MKSSVIKLTSTLLLLVALAGDLQGMDDVHVSLSVPLNHLSIGKDARGQFDRSCSIWSRFFGHRKSHRSCQSHRRGSCKDDGVVS